MKFTQDSIYLKVKPELDMEFGKFGGMYVPDPFSPVLEDLAKKAIEIVQTTEFIENRKKVLNVLDISIPEITKVGDIKDAEVYKIQSPVFPLILSGYLALANILDRTPSFAASDENKLDMFVRSAEFLGLKVYVALDKRLSQKTALVEKLVKAGHTVDSKKCVELFDDPILYAFQYFISNINNALYVPVDANSGPYPFPSLTVEFTTGFKKVLEDIAAKQFDNKLSALLACAYPGTSAVAAYRFCDDCDTRLISVEPAFEFDRNDCYCGIFTKVVKVGEEERILCPELVYSWETGEVDRVFADDFTTALAAMEIKGKVLVVEGC